MSTFALESNIAQPHTPMQLALLDDSQEWSAFSKPVARAADTWESNVVIEGMHCAACSLNLEQALLAVPGVVSAQVSSASHRAQVTWRAGQTFPSRWFDAVERAGYRALPANDIFAREQRRASTRKALWRWLVAGLCMMQVMMYAYPAYVAQAGDLTAEMEQLLRWASWVLTLPVMLFSCGPFFQNAMRDLSQRRVSMDLPVALGIAITFIVSTAGTFEPTGIFGKEVYFDSLTMFVFFLLTGRWLELRMRDKTAGALEALINRLPDSVERATPQGDFECIAVRRVRVGDLLRVHPGQAFAADGVLEQGHTLVDEALLTGESRPMAKALGQQVVAGSHNVGSTVLMRVQSVGQDTRFSRIVALMGSAASSKPRSALLADKLAKPFLLGVMAAAALACAWWWTRDPERALMVAVAVLVVTCPCALSLATPAAMLAAAGNLARNALLVRNLQSIEVLAKVDTFVFDKTGTLTSDVMQLSQVVARPGFETSQVLEMARAMARHSLHPVSRALTTASHPNATPSQSAPKADDWVCQAVTESIGEGISGLVHTVDVDGTAHSRLLRLGSANYCEAHAHGPTEPVGLAVYLSDDAGWLATFVLQGHVRGQAKEVVNQLRQAGVAVHLLSGDGAFAVQTVAGQLGIDHAKADCSPADKLRYLRTLQEQGHVVAMVGDGLNDGPTLAGADVSFAFGQAVPLAQSKADFVVIGAQLEGVLHAWSLARTTMKIVRQNLWWALLYNIACIPLAVMGWIPAWLAGLGMAASSLVVVANALRLASPSH